MANQEICTKCFKLETEALTHETKERADVANFSQSESEVMCRDASSRPRGSEVSRINYKYCLIYNVFCWKDWKSSMVLPMYKGKSDPMECGSYRRIKLLEHVMKVVERIFEHRIRQQIVIDECSLDS